MSAPAFRVRGALLADHDALCALFDQLDAVHRDARPDFFRAFDGPARTCEQVEQWLVGPGSTVLVVEGDAGVIGLAVLVSRAASGFAGAVPRHVVEVDNLVVGHDWRGRGVGRCLLDAALEWSRERGASHLEVAVHAFNSDAKRFYERFGFADSIHRLAMAA